jgi:hypothetical protein
MTPKQRTIGITIGVFFSVAALSGCDILKGDKAEESASKTEPASADKADKAPEKPADKAGDKKPDEEAKDDKVVAKAEPPAKAAAPEEIDVDALLDAPSASGFASVELNADAVAQAPRLGAHAAEDNAAIREADWLVLPGGKLEIPNPKGWVRKRDDKSGILMSPDQKVAIVFTTFTDMKQVVAKLDEIGKLAKITKVQWKEPKTVKLGEDSLAAVVRGGDVTTEAGTQGGIIFALVETGAAEKVLAIGLRENDAPKEEKDVGAAVLLSMRSKR